ncbi:MAG TPA: CDP-alcohol phosphatidyltransferase family protein [Microlunatus sp.]
MNLGGPRPWRPLATGAFVEGAGLAVAGGAGLLTPLPVLGATLGYLGGAAAILVHWRRRSFGAANLVTLARVVGTGWVIGLTLQAVSGQLTATGVLAMVVVGTCCLVLDGVDGKVARARRETTAFGARFDMETDAALLMALSLAVPALGITGWWVLAIGGMRYAYVAASWIAPARVRTALRIPLPFHYSRKVVAVVQAVTLLAVLALDLIGAVAAVPALPSILVAGSLGALCWSFGRDVVWQLRSARRPR